MRNRKENASPTRDASADTRFLSPFGVGMFYVATIFVSPLSVSFLNIFKLGRYISLLVESGICYFVLLGPLTYFLSPGIFSKKFWFLSHKCLKGIASVVAVQLLVLVLTPGAWNHPQSNVRAFAAIVIAPLIEELIRATMIIPLTRRWGRFWGIVITTALDIFAHPSPKKVVPQLFALSIAFVYCEYSIPGNVIAHFLINLITIVAGRLRSA